VRPDNLDALPFADTADQDPNALPFDDPQARPCEACGADAGEPCRPWCIGEAAQDDVPTCPHLYRADWYGGRRCWCCQAVKP
jgi:hypothetical protein